MINYHLTITGRVQGVGFRWSVYQLAQQAGIDRQPGGGPHGHRLVIEGYDIEGGIPNGQKQVV